VSRLRKIVTILVLVPLAIALIVFAVANREIVTVSLDPFDPAQPALSVRMPLFILIFVFLIAGVLLGGFAAWLRQGRHRRASRALRSDLTGLRREIGILNARLETQDDTRDPDIRNPGPARVPLPPPMV
jgi:uncharacterized integral membrane protein